MPWLVVFQTPPAAVATYQVSGLAGSTAMSMIRPEVRAGPMPRRGRPAKVPALRGSFFSSFFFFSAAAFDFLSAFGAALSAAEAAALPPNKRLSTVIQMGIRFTER